MARSIENITSRDGTSISYRRSGSGPPLVLVHGTGGFSSSWLPVAAALAEQLTLYAVDRRGRGQSGDTAPYCVEREFDDIAALVDSIGGSVNVLGHSFGAVCALGAALRTSRIGKLLLYEPPLCTDERQLCPEPVLQRLQALLDAGDHEALLGTHLLEIAGLTPAELEHFRGAPSWGQRLATAPTIPRELRAAASYRLVPERLCSMSVPTLLLLGSESPAFFRAGTQELQQALPDSRLLTLQGQSHVAMHSAPQLFVRELLAFLGRMRAAAEP